MNVNEKRGMAKSEDFMSVGFENWVTPSGIQIEISGGTTNTSAYGNVEIEMINKRGMLGHVGGTMFRYANEIATEYENLETFTYSK